MSSYPITQVLEEITKDQDAKWSRQHDGSIVIQARGRQFRIRAGMYEDTGVAQIRIVEEKQA
jgi:hypothetical protein